MQRPVVDHIEVVEMSKPRRNEFTASFLADPTRRRILEMLSERELAAGEIARRFDMTPPAVSQHLKILRNADLVRVRNDAQRRMYALEPHGLTEFEHWLTRIARR